MIGKIYSKIKKSGNLKNPINHGYPVKLKI